MGKDTGISWTDHTFNPWWGCAKVSPGCKNCYAETFASRYGHSIWGPEAPRREFGEKHWMDPVRWNNEACREKRMHRVFCGSMCDVFEDHPTANKWRPKLWVTISNTPWLDWQLLTKRPENISKFLPRDWGSGYHNVWLGTSIENQDMANVRLPVIRRIPARVRFLSAEPLLERILLDYALPSGSYTCDWNPKWAAGIHWVIAGGESGQNRRSCDPDWIQDLYSQCKADSVAFFCKQDSALKSGQQGRIPDVVFNTKQFPDVT